MKKRLFLPTLFFILITIQSMGSVTFIMKNYTAQAGSQITVPVQVTSFNNVMSIQGTIQFDPAKLQFVSVQDFGALGMVISDFGTSLVSGGKLTFAWIQASMTGVTLLDSATIFSLKFNVLGTAGQTTPLQFVNSPTPFEVIDPTMSPISYLLVNGSVSITTTTSIHDNGLQGMQILQNQPNPCSDYTKVQFNIQHEGKVSLELFDIQGRQLALYQEIFPAGMGSFVLNLKNINGMTLPGGTYLYRIKYEKNTGVGKILVIN